MNRFETAPPSIRFDDHLALATRRFSGVRAVIFHGLSGSGKSTCIDHLVTAHPDFRDMPHARIDGGPIEWGAVRASEERLVILDELLAPADVLALARLLRAGHVVIAASHLPAWLTGALGTVWPMIQFATDRDAAKIARHLARLGIHASQGAVADYCRRYGATYTDAEIILEHTGEDDFDRAWRRFTRLCTIDRVRRRRAWS